MSKKLKTWKNKRRICRTKRSGRYASKGHCLAYHRELQKANCCLGKLFSL